MYGTVVRVLNNYGICMTESLKGSCGFSQHRNLKCHSCTFYQNSGRNSATGFTHIQEV